MKRLNFATVGLAVMATIFLLSGSLLAGTTTYHSSERSAYASCYDFAYDEGTQTYTSTYFDSWWSESRQRTSGSGGSGGPGGGPVSYGYAYYSTYSVTYSETGYVEQGSYGYGEVTDQSITQFDSATASATLTVYHYMASYDYETGEYTYTDLGSEDVAVDVALSGFGSTIKSRSSGGYVDPSHFNQTYNFLGQYRQATSTILIGDQAFSPVDGDCYGQLSEGKSNYMVTYNP